MMEKANAVTIVFFIACKDITKKESNKVLQRFFGSLGVQEFGSLGV